MNNKTRLLFLFFAFLSTSIIACVVPVFRYALERWDAANFPCYIFSQGELTGDAKDAFNILREASTATSRCNISPVLVDINKKQNNPAIRNLINKNKGKKLPSLTLCFPGGSSVQGEFLSATLTSQLAMQITHSPTLNELASRLMTGTTAVFLFVESGDKAKDIGARQMLSMEFSVLKAKLRLPVITKEMKPDWFDERRGPKLRIDFSIISISKSNPDEYVLLQTLRKGFPDFGSGKKDAFIFPVFGQGRCLGGYPVDKLTPSGIQQICSFMVGMCSCEIKEMNPGFDLIIRNNWRNLAPDKDASLEPVKPEDLQLPKLAGLSSVPLPSVKSSESTTNNNDLDSGVQKKPEPLVKEGISFKGSKLYLALFAGLIIIIVISVIAGLYFRSKKK